MLGLVLAAAGVVVWMTAREERKARPVGIGSGCSPFGG